MPKNAPNTASQKEKAEGSRDHVADEAKRATDRTLSGHEHGEDNSEQTLKHPGRNDN